jgi:N-acetylneuraminic acid mutarotase
MNRPVRFLIIVLLFSLSISTVLVSYVKSDEASWTAKQPMPTARGGLGVAVVDGKIYAIGGSDGHFLTANEMYDPSADSWTTKTPMLTERAYFGIAVHQNRIYVIGGATGDGLTGVNEVYYPSTDTWETKTPMPTPRVNLCANVANGKIYLIGGNTFTSLTWPLFSNKTEVYDPATDSWTQKAPLPNFVGLGNADLTSTVVDNKIYVMGSEEGAGADFNQIYDPETDTWSSGANVPTEVYGPAAAATTGVFAPKRIHVLSGYTH